MHIVALLPLVILIIGTARQPDLQPDPGGHAAHRQDGDDPAGGITGLHAGQYGLRLHAGHQGAAGAGTVRLSLRWCIFSIYVGVDYGFDLQLILLGCRRSVMCWWVSLPS